jgi:hypothetical protein
VGLALGKGGARIKQVEAETKVTSINVTGDSGGFYCCCGVLGEGFIVCFFGRWVMRGAVGC